MVRRRRGPSLSRVFIASLSCTLLIFLGGRLLSNGYAVPTPSALPLASGLARFWLPTLQKPRSWSDEGDAASYDAWVEAKQRAKTAAAEAVKLRGPATPRRETDTPEIPISPGLPSLDDLDPSSPVAIAWSDAISSLEGTAAELARRQLRGDAVHGVPGTAIVDDEERTALQRYLDCVAAQGSWVYDRLGSHLYDGGAGGLTVHKNAAELASCDKRHYRAKHDGADAAWDVREGLRYRWAPAQACERHLPPSLAPGHSSFALQTKPDPARLPSRRELCRLLRDKAVVIVGDGPTGYLTHDLLLDWTTDKPQTCYGDQFCKEHLMCSGSLLPPTSNGTAALGWERDETPFVRLPTPPVPLAGASQVPRAPVEPPSELPTRGRGTLLRYRRSDGGYLRGSPSLPPHDPAYVHPATGVREFNNYALALARRSDVVIFSKSPLPVPRPGSALGNATAALQGGEDWEGEGKAVAAIELAATLTRTVWLPELVESLKALRHPAHDHLVVYRGTWRIPADCASPRAAMAWTDGARDRFWPVGDGPPPHPHLPTLRQLIFPSNPPSKPIDVGSPLTELHALVYNLQTVLQNHLARTALLPMMGVPYLDVEAPLGVWRSGFVAGADPSNCVQPCLPSPGLALEHAFLGGLHRVMEWGWAADADRVARWVGDGFVPLVKRAKASQSR